MKFVMMLCLIAVMVSLAESSRNGGRCHISARLMQRIVHNLCTSRLKRDTDESKREIHDRKRDIHIMLDMEKLPDGVKLERVKRSDTPLSMLVTYCHANCCSVNQVTNICRSG